MLCREDAPNAHPHSPKVHNTYYDTCSGVLSGQPTYGWCSYSIANVLWSSPRHGAHPSQKPEPFIKRRNLLGSYHIRQLAKQWTRTKYFLCYYLSETISPKDPNKCSELSRKLELLPSQKSVTCGPPLREVRCQLFGFFLRFSDFSKTSNPPLTGNR